MDLYTNSEPPIKPKETSVEDFIPTIINYWKDNIILAELDSICKEIYGKLIPDDYRINFHLKWFLNIYSDFCGEITEEQAEELYNKYSIK